MSEKRIGIGGGGGAGSLVKARIAQQPLKQPVVGETVVDPVKKQPVTTTTDQVSSTPLIPAANKKDVLTAQQATAVVKELQRYDEAVKQLSAAPHRRAAMTVRADKTERPAKKGDSDALVNEQLMFCLGKSPERVRDDMERRLARFDVVIGTKADNAQFEALKADPALRGKRISFDEVSQVLTVESGDRPKKGLVVVVAGGAKDLPIARWSASRRTTSRDRRHRRVERCCPRSDARAAATDGRLHRP